MSFPYNTPLEILQSLVTMALSSSSFLVGASTFLLGKYLDKSKAHAPKSELGIFVLLIVSLLAFPIVSMIAVGILVFFSCQEMWLKAYLFLVTLTPIVPAIAIISIVSWKYPRGDA
jgi:nitrate reductase NapE component